MKVEKVVVGLLEENCYLLIKDDKCIIVDPGDEYNKIKNKIESLNLTVIGVLITHAHFDHIGALDKLLNDYNTYVYYHNINNEIVYDKLIDVKEEKYQISNFKFEVIYTKGHRNDSVTYYFYNEGIMFTGDFIFKLSIGRTDLEYGNYQDIINSIDKIKTFNDKIIIYPGHGEETNLKYEIENNYYFKENK